MIFNAPDASLFCTTWDWKENQWEYFLSLSSSFLFIISRKTKIEDYQKQYQAHLLHLSDSLCFSIHILGLGLPCQPFVQELKNSCMNLELLYKNPLDSRTCWVWWLLCGQIRLNTPSVWWIPFDKRHGQLEFKQADQRQGSAFTWWGLGTMTGTLVGMHRHTFPPCSTGIQDKGGCQLKHCSAQSLWSFNVQRGGKEIKDGWRLKIFIYLCET